MALPAVIEVKISSEAAGEISMTPVLTRKLPLAELLAVLLGICGAKDAARLRELLARGTVVESASRFRWSPVEASEAELRVALSDFPDADSARAFDASRCVAAIFHGSRSRIEIPREIGAARRFLRRKSFWDSLMVAARAHAPAYLHYDYRRRGDVYRMAVRVSELAPERLPYSGLAQQIARGDFSEMDLVVAR